ncbi:RusA family crossover junction endodeoxyribonuclease [Sulfitobacter sp. R18_1]|uniref:RusA family crossover junction endodeoxyribonuclease n=1 Tax=Sulfitobacter sp. R18_1 TaxID=2821104 RepID=UPI001ADB0342|nr:RusA family crossover junction endodeoxyribonuclease [Sulfitobacter sp. R18_1]MBO9428515.1 RusA family crossover junction endodeoxyribonuclease [Sulfitobacter sp. R18_1]
MAARLTKAEALKLGIKIPGMKKAKKSKARWDVNDKELHAQEPIVLNIPVTPKPKHRPRTFVDEGSIRSAFFKAKGNVAIFLKEIRMRTMTTSATKEFEKHISETARILVRGEPIKGPVFVDAIFTLPGDESQWPTSMHDGDLDNHEKSVLDALNGICYTDDRMIVRKFSAMRCGEAPGSVYIRVSPARVEDYFPGLEDIDK